MAKAKNKLSGMINEAPMPPRESTKQEAAERKRWQAEDALRTITSAEEIKKDRGLMAHVRKCANEQMKNLQCVIKKK